MVLFFLISTINCVPTKQESVKTFEPARETEKAEQEIFELFDVSGSWIMTNDWSISNCDTGVFKDIFRHRSGDLMERMTVEITQKGNIIKLMQVEPRRSFDGTINNRNIYLNKKRFSSKGIMGIFEYEDYTLTIGQNADTLSGKAEWTFSNREGDASCDGLLDLTLLR